ncbi:MAG: LysM peptidoglycan-binding domain-containing protein [Chloroflexi bacterium]|nr:LysM peptidoglycan-binding domain-containing protein [Chloroflexota bacterium]
MYQRAILSSFVVIVLLTAFALAPQANASPLEQTGTFQSRYFNFFDAGGRECPDASAVYVSGDTEIFKYWPEGSSPAPGLVNPTNYMVCWKGTVYFPYAGTYTVYTLNDDGMNVWVDGKIAMNAWYNQGPTWHQGDFNIPAPGYYSFEVKYYNAPNAGVACVSWAAKSQPYTWKCPYPPGPTPVPVYPTFVPVYPTPIPPCPYYPNCYNPPPQPCPYQPGCYNPQPYPVPQPYPPPQPTCYYRVRYGDTLYSIGWKFGVTVWQLTQWNHLVNPNYIYAGMVLEVCPY